MNQNTNKRSIRSSIITRNNNINIVSTRKISKHCKKSADLTPCIFAGGYSSRMGFPKALALLDGRPLLTIIYEQLQSFFEKDPIVIANDDAIISAFPQYEFYRDIHPHCGPLSGLESALTQISTTYLYTVACDMPFFEPSAARLLLEAMDGSPDAIIPLCYGKMQPLEGIYHQRILPAVTASLEKEDFGFQKFLSTLDFVKTVDVSAYEKAFTNVNTPEELESIQ